MLWSILVIAVGLYVGLVAILFIFQNNLLYLPNVPTRSIVMTPAVKGLAYEDVWIETADGLRLSGWFIPAEPERSAVLFFHGNAGNISHRLDSIEIFHRLGLSTFIIDYRGYGQSEGRPSEIGTYLDAEAAWDYLVEQRQFSPTKIIFFGRSLGGAVATRLAQAHPPGALILESTFTSVPDLAAEIYPFLPIRLLARLNYNSLQRLPEIKSPIMIVHSPQDEIIPYSHGRQLFAAASEPKEFLEIEGDHNQGFYVSAKQYETGLDTFITRYLKNEAGHR